MDAKEKEIQLFKSGIKSLQDVVDRQKNTETKKVSEVSSQIVEYQTKLERAEAEAEVVKIYHFQTLSAPLASSLMQYGFIPSLLST